MSSARGTPRYVEVIGPVPMGPHLMGPHEAVVPALQPAPSVQPREGRRGSSGIIPLHPPVPAPAYSPIPSAPAAPSVPRAPRKPGVPLDRRPWRVMVVSASPGAAPRSFAVARWQARTVVALLALLTILSAGFVAAVVVAVRSPDLFTESVDVQALRAELAATQDSLALLREGGAAEEGSGDAGEAPAPAAAAPAPAVASPAPAAARPVAKPAADRPKPLSARPARTPVRDMSALLSMPRSLEDLPVIGALASGFSRARRHPLLHLTRPHLGVDVAAPRGTRVSAPAPGRVIFVGRKIGFGLVVELDHGQGITTRYAHLRSSAVQAGEQVTKGEAIAAVGTSGVTTGPHLHYEVLVHGKQVDPLRFRFSQNEPAAAAVVAAPVAASVPVLVVPPPPPANPVGSGGPAGPVNGTALHEAPPSTTTSPSPR